MTIIKLDDTDRNSVKEFVVRKDNTGVKGSRLLFKYLISKLDQSEHN